MLRRRSVDRTAQVYIVLRIRCCFAAHVGDDAGFRIFSDAELEHHECGTVNLSAFPNKQVTARQLLVQITQHR